MEQSTRSCMAGLQAHNVDIQVYSVTPAGQGKILFESLGIPVTDHPYRGIYGWRTHVQLRRSLTSATADVVLVTGPTLTGCFAARTIHCDNRHLAVHFHHFSRGKRDWMKWRLFYILFGKDYRTIIYPSRFLMNEAAKIAPELASRMVILPNPIDRIWLPSKREKDIAKEELGLPPNALVVGNAGWLIRRKRFDVFLAVAAQLLQSIPHCHFVISGDGPLKNILVQQAQSLGLENKITFLGWQSSLYKFYVALDLLIFNTDADASPMVPIEAMAHSVPVIASATYGGLDEIVLDGITGFLFCDHDIDQLTRCAVSLLTDEALRNRVVDTAREKLRHEHSIEAVTQRFMGLCQIE
jgi:glycosyltransferase involved in cell wall biosynthesis